MGFHPEMKMLYLTYFSIAQDKGVVVGGGGCILNISFLFFH